MNTRANVAPRMTSPIPTTPSGRTPIKVDAAPIFISNIQGATAQPTGFNVTRSQYDTAHAPQFPQIIPSAPGGLTPRVQVRTAPKQLDYASVNIDASQRRPVTRSISDPNLYASAQTSSYMPDASYGMSARLPQYQTAFTQRHIPQSSTTAAYQPYTDVSAWSSAYTAPFTDGSYLPLSQPESYFLYQRPDFQGFVYNPVIHAIVDVNICKQLVRNRTMEVYDRLVALANNYHLEFKPSYAVARHIAVEGIQRVWDLIEPSMVELYFQRYRSRTEGASADPTQQPKQMPPMHLYYQPGQGPYPSAWVSNTYGKGTSVQLNTQGVSQAGLFAAADMAIPGPLRQARTEKVQASFQETLAKKVDYSALKAKLPRLAPRELPRIRRFPTIINGAVPERYNQPLHAFEAQRYYGLCDFWLNDKKQYIADESDPARIATASKILAELVNINNPRQRVVECLKNLEITSIPDQPGFWQQALNMGFPPIVKVGDKWLMLGHDHPVLQDMLKVTSESISSLAAEIEKTERETRANPSINTDKLIEETLALFRAAELLDQGAGRQPASLEEAQTYFDVPDFGFDPDAASNWMAAGHITMEKRAELRTLYQQLETALTPQQRIDQLTLWHQKNQGQPQAVPAQPEHLQEWQQLSTVGVPNFELRGEDWHPIASVKHEKAYTELVTISLNLKKLTQPAQRIAYLESIGKIPPQNAYPTDHERLSTQPLYWVYLAKKVPSAPYLVRKVNERTHEEEWHLATNTPHREFWQAQLTKLEHHFNRRDKIDEVAKRQLAEVNNYVVQHQIEPRHWPRIKELNSAVQPIKVSLVNGKLKYDVSQENSATIKAARVLLPNIERSFAELRSQLCAYGIYPNPAIGDTPDSHEGIDTFWYNEAIIENAPELEEDQEDGEWIVPSREPNSVAWNEFRVQLTKHLNPADRQAIIDNSPLMAAKRAEKIAAKRAQELLQKQQQQQTPTPPNYITPNTVVPEPAQVVHSKPAHLRLAEQLGFPEFMWQNGEWVPVGEYSPEVKAQLMHMEKQMQTIVNNLGDDAANENLVKAKLQEYLDAVKANLDIEAKKAHPAAIIKALYPILMKKAFPVQTQPLVFTQTLPPKAPSPPPPSTTTVTPDSTPRPTPQPSYWLIVKSLGLNVPDLVIGIDGKTYTVGNAIAGGPSKAKLEALNAALATQLIRQNGQITEEQVKATAARYGLRPDQEGDQTQALATANQGNATYWLVEANIAMNALVQTPELIYQEVEQKFIPKAQYATLLEPLFAELAALPTQQQRQAKVEHWLSQTTNQRALVRIIGAKAKFAALASQPNYWAYVMEVADHLPKLQKRVIDGALLPKPVAADTLTPLLAAKIQAAVTEESFNADPQKAQAEIRGILRTHGALVDPDAELPEQSQDKAERFEETSWSTPISEAITDMPPLQRSADGEWTLERMPESGKALGITAWKELVRKVAYAETQDARAQIVKQTASLLQPFSKVHRLGVEPWQTPPVKQVSTQEPKDVAFMPPYWQAINQSLELPEERFPPAPFQGKPASLLVTKQKVAVAAGQEQEQWVLDTSSELGQRLEPLHNAVIAASVSDNIAATRKIMQARGMMPNKDPLYVEKDGKLQKADAETQRQYNEDQIDMALAGANLYWYEEVMQLSDKLKAQLVPGESCFPWLKLKKNAEGIWKSSDDALQTFIEQQQQRTASERAEAAETAYMFAIRSAALRIRAQYMQDNPGLSSQAAAEQYEASFLADEIKISEDINRLKYMRARLKDKNKYKDGGFTLLNADASFIGNMAVFDLVTKLTNEEKTIPSQEELDEINDKKGSDWTKLHQNDPLYLDKEGKPEMGMATVRKLAGELILTGPTKTSEEGMTKPKLVFQQSEQTPSTPPAEQTQATPPPSGRATPESQPETPPSLPPQTRQKAPSPEPVPRSSSPVRPSSPEKPAPLQVQVTPTQVTPTPSQVIPTVQVTPPGPVTPVADNRARVAWNQHPPAWRMARKLLNPALALPQAVLDPTSQKHMMPKGYEPLQQAYDNLAAVQLENPAKLTGEDFSLIITSLFNNGLIDLKGVEFYALNLFPKLYPGFSPVELDRVLMGTQPIYWRLAIRAWNAPFLVNDPLKPQQKGLMISTLNSGYGIWQEAANEISHFADDVASQEACISRITSHALMKGDGAAKKAEMEKELEKVEQQPLPLLNPMFETINAAYLDQLRRYEIECAKLEAEQKNKQ